MWWIPIILASCLLIVVKNSLYRTNSFSWGMVACVVVILVLAETGFWNGIRMANSFFQPWFLGLAAMALFGLAASYVLGDTGLTTKHYVGMAMAIGSGFLLAT